METEKKKPSSMEELGWQYNHAICNCFPPGILPAQILVNSSKAEIKKVACLRNTPTDIVTSVSRGSETALSYFSTTIKQNTVQDFTRSWSGLYFYQEQVEQLHSWFEFEMKKNVSFLKKFLLTQVYNLVPHDARKHWWSNSCHLVIRRKTELQKHWVIDIDVQCSALIHPLSKPH